MLGRRSLRGPAKYCTPECAGRRNRPDHEPRRGHPATAECVYNDDEVEFMKAMERFKREQRVPFPTCSQVLKVLLGLGYRKCEGT